MLREDCSLIQSIRNEIVQRLTSLCRSVERLLKSSCGFTVASFMDRNWNCKRRKRIRILSSRLTASNWVASSPQLAAEVIAHSLWSRQAWVPCQPPKIGNSLRLAKWWVSIDTLMRQFTVLEAYDDTLLHPGTRSWRNFILWLIFSLRTY